MISQNYRVFIIPTEDPSFNVFIIPCDDIDCSSFDKAYSVLSRITGIEKVLKEIWVPEFSLKVQNSSEIKGNNAEEIISCKESAFVSLKSALHSKGNLLLEPKQESVIIDSGFVFGLIHAKVDEEYEVPYIAVYVRPQDFVTAY